jgi:hypothetical protein
MTKQEFKEHKKSAIQIKRNDYLLNKIFSLWLWLLFNRVWVNVE